MRLEHTLHRLAQAVNPTRKEASRAQLLKRIGALPLRRCAEQMNPLGHRKLRSEILGRISQPRTTGALSDLRSFLSPSRSAFAHMRSEILDRILHWEPTPAWEKFRPHGWKKWAAVTAMLTLVLRLTPTLFIATPLQAVSQNLLIPTEGFVSITDGAEWSVVNEELELTGPLTIRTGTDSAATIVIRDEAVLRLAENTEVNLKEAAFDPEIDSPIARIIYGQVWVSGLLPEALFAGTTLIFPQGTLALKEGSVSILADPQQSTVQVYHRFAKVLPIGSDPVHLVQGDQLTLLPEAKTQRHLITDTMKSDQWVLTNRSRDAVHRTEVAEHKQEIAKIVAGILPTSTFYSLKRASEQIDLWLTLSLKSRQVKRLRHAQTRLNEAVTLLSAGKLEEAENPLAAYRETIRSFASVSEQEARDLLSASLVSSSTTVASALPHSNLYVVKREVLKAAAETKATEISAAEVDLYLLSDALLGIESLIAEGEITRAVIVFNGIDGAVASVLERQELGETKVEKADLKIVKTILRSIDYSLEQAKEFVPAEQSNMLALLQERVTSQFPSSQPVVVVTTEENKICMTVREVLRRTNQFLASVYTYQTPRAQRNEVLRQIASLPDCPQSGRVLAKVMNKVPVFTRSFVWEALREVETAT